VRRALAPALVAALALLTGACGGQDTRADATPRVVVSAAASLTTAFTAYARAIEDRAEVRLSFSGSDELAAQIRQGVRPDVFAAANTALPAELHAEGLVEAPVTFAANRLVLAVPARAPGGRPRRVDRLEDLERPAITIAIGADGVPVGTYTRAALDRLPPARRDAVLANVRTEEPDVGGIVGKLTQGAVDAGFVYRSDVRAADGALEAIELPAALQPEVAYGVAVVKGAPEPEAARRFVAGLLRGKGARALAAAGFEPPPGR